MRGHFVERAQILWIDTAHRHPDNPLGPAISRPVAGIHQGFSQSEAENTKRLMAAACNPYVHILALPTGRLLREREPYKVNLEVGFLLNRASWKSGGQIQGDRCLAVRTAVADESA